MIKTWPCSDGGFKMKVPPKIMYHDDDRILSKDGNSVSS